MMMTVPVSERPTTDLAELLTSLGDRVAPISMAGERTLDTAAVLADLFPEGGLVRGRVFACSGAAATSVALTLVGPALIAGAWAAVIDLPTMGLDAAAELGVPLERVVGVDAGAEGERWADAVAAAADGFDVLIARVPSDMRASTARKVSTRLQQRGVVLVIVGDPGPMVCDGVLDTTVQTWNGLGAGWGHLVSRSLDVSTSGRRMPGRRCRTMELPVDQAVDQAPDQQIEGRVTVEHRLDAVS